MDIYYISGTHWDREWYQTYQGFRVRLVKMVDKLIDVLENEDTYGVFHFDGQTIVLEDYLEIMPENKERLKKLIQSGKIKIGPWYCMPDEFLVSGESLIKNLKKGMEISKEYNTKALNCGYICDIFGHIAQMPQIFKKLGIDNAVIWRGIGDDKIPMFFDWVSPDGSSVKTVRLNPDNGYASFTVDVLGRDESKIPYLTDDVLKKNLKSHIDTEIKRANLPYLYLSDALDHISCHENTAHYIELIKELYPEANVHHVSMEKLFEEIKDLPVPEYKGEIYEFKKTHDGPTIFNTLSSRYKIKKANDNLQNFIEIWISPLYAFKRTNMPKSYLELAYTFLLRNHPHDSICGCSLDRVHENMMYRFNQCEEILTEIFDRFKLDATHTADGFEKVIRIFNPLPYSVEKFCEFNVCFEEDYPKFYMEGMGYEKINGFKIYDENGSEVEYSVTDINTDRNIRVVDQIFKRADVYTVSLNVKLRPMGDTYYKIVPCGVPVRYFGNEAYITKKIDNEHISVTVNCDGSINLTDKATDTEYKNLISPVSCGEIGDGWIHVSPASDFYSASTSAFVEVTESSAVKTTIKITQTMRLPKTVINDKRGYHRSGEYVNLDIVSFVTAGKNDRYVSVKTIVNNTAENHRLSLIFPSGTANGEYSVNQAFAFVKRKIVDFNRFKNYFERPTKYMQNNGIIYTKDENKGLAVISEGGFHEGGVDRDGNIVFTLFRAFSNFYMTNGETESNALEKMEFNYIIMPLDKNIKNTDIQRRQDVLRAGTEYVEYNGKCETGSTYGIEFLDESFVYSTAYRTKDNSVGIRIYNAENENVKGKIRLPDGIKDAVITDFNDNVIKKCETDGNILHLSLGPFEIVTLSLK